MGVSLFLARRLSLSSGGKKSSPAVRVAIAAVALSVAVMMCAIAVVMGFKREIKGKVAAFNSPITLMADVRDASSSPEQEQSNIFALTPSLMDVLQQSDFITDIAPQASIPAIFKTRTDFKGIYLKSLSGLSLSDFINNSTISGKVPDYSSDGNQDKIVISSKAADQLGLKVGDTIDTYFITDRISVRRLKVAAIFNSHFDAYDDAYAYGDISLIRTLGNLSSREATSLSISVDDFSRVAEYSDRLQSDLIKAYTSQHIYRMYRVETALQNGAAYFQWLSLLDMNVIVVLALMTVVACVTLVSGMLILMIDKVRFIALISALGASRRIIRRVFILLAVRIALYGLFIGDCLALAILLLQNKYHILPLDPDSYYIDFVPVEISIPALIILNILSILVIFIVLILPARFAGKAAPARTLSAE